jgi:hypothetical protein
MIFAQLMDFFPKHAFHKCVGRYGGNRRVRSFTCLDQFLCMAFAQLTYRESLRDIETCLRAMHSKLYHAGLRGKVSRSTLADANESRDWRIHADVASVLIAEARKLYVNESFAVELDQTAYALDSTTVDLCLSLFPWAQFRRRKSAVKLHTLLDFRGNIPCFVHISSGRISDVTVLDLLPIEAGAFYVLDRGYTDFARLYRLNQDLAFFVIRAKRRLDYARRSYMQVDKTTGLRSDSTIRLRGPKSSKLYPDPLRRITYYASDIQKRFTFLTNNFTLPALTIAELYKSRWQVELFFKWIKQHLRIKTFFGTSVNAVKTQVWIAVCVYVLVAIVKKQLKSQRSLNEILQILSITLFENTPISQALSRDIDQMQRDPFCNQLSLFEL